MKPPLTLGVQVLLGIKIAGIWYIPHSQPPDLMRINFFGPSYTKLIFPNHMFLVPTAYIEMATYGEPTLLTSGTITEE